MLTLEFERPPYRPDIVKDLAKFDEKWLDCSLIDWDLNPNVQKWIYENNIRISPYVLIKFHTKNVAEYLNVKQLKPNVVMESGAFYSVIGVGFAFENHNDAILFKLRWG